MRPEAHADTIVAIATAPGRGGVGVVRVSGPAAGTIAAAILDKVVRAPREAIHSQFLDATGKPIDEGIALFFAGPRSYTGEDVLELQGHGGPIVLEMLLARTLELGARRAQPGEFTQRAFLNDKLDLAQAEAVADLIDAGSTAAAKAAVRSLQGDFSAQVRELVEALIELRVWVEAAIDFPEEEIDFLADQTLIRKLEALRQRFKDILRSAQRGRLLRDGMTVVIAGRPNAGKSSLLNALAGYEAAIVTPLAGTTRDVLREHIAIDGMPLHIVDTAGLRAQGEAATDIVEIEGMRRARAEMIHADRVLFVVDSLDDAAAKSWADERNNLPPSVPVTVLFNKIDSLEGDDSVARSLAARPLPGADRILCISAATGSGLDVLREHLKQCMGFDSGESSAFSARTRHLEALTRAELHADAAMRQLAESRAGELVAEELRSAQRALAEITGEFHAEDLLGRIFGSFCIGK